MSKKTTPTLREKLGDDEYIKHLEHRTLKAELENQLLSKSNTELIADHNQKLVAYEKWSKDERQHWLSLFERLLTLTHEINMLNASIAHVSSGALAGAGNAQRETVKHWAGIVAYWYEQVKLTVADLAARMPNISIATNNEFVETLSKAIERFYVTGDASDMFILPGDSPQLLEHYVTISDLKPGVGKAPVIQRLLDRARLYKEDGYTWGENYDQLVTDLEDPANDDEKEESKYLETWNTDALKTAYNRREREFASGT